jgi:ketosteroid isomerase-like protein
LLAACAAPAREAASRDAEIRDEISDAMDRYQAAARVVNPDSIVAFYTETATLFEPGIMPIRGRDSIRAFLASFSGVQVEVATVSPDTIEVFENMALYWGTYFERLTFAGQPASEQHGKFVAEWVRQPGAGWRLQRLFRVPIPSLQPPGRW